MTALHFPTPETSAAAEALRAEVRDFLAETLKDYPPHRRAESWFGFDADFSARLAARGWIAMTWPKRYGGHERSALERYVVLEELLAAGAPVAAHWIADRQSGPSLLKFGTEAQKAEILPKIAAGKCFFCIGMSEPDAGSDLAAVRMLARKVEGGFTVNGTKLWTSFGHNAHYMILFCRTDPASQRQEGTSQFLVDLKTPGISIKPIHDIAGKHHFNEVHFTDVFLPDAALIGTLGNGWQQVTSELALERSGPERFLSSFELLVQMVAWLQNHPSAQAEILTGRLVAHLAVLRRLSRSVATLLEQGENPNIQAAIVKDLGATLEQEMPEAIRHVLALEPMVESPDPAAAVLAHIILNAPGFSLRGGTREILRGIIARGLGLR
ncbi:MAG: acyl-CoA dehydrogenase family protein [Alphaproteobacteria bacterium]|nr:acyl-CoA dehydrogenase family protein [Alphaproteobacteria bacterium]MBU0886647.1 acyl-CoA dehydrogenase family protein [Alphaproteobacteria bacterium]